MPRKFRNPKRYIATELDWPRLLELGRVHHTPIYRLNAHGEFVRVTEVPHD